MEASTKAGLLMTGAISPGHLGSTVTSQNTAMRSRRMRRKAAEKERREVARLFRCEADKHGIAVPPELDGRYVDTSFKDWLLVYLERNPEAWQLIEEFRRIDQRWRIG